MHEVSINTGTQIETIDISSASEQRRRRLQLEADTYVKDEFYETKFKKEYLRLRNQRPARRRLQQAACEPIHTVSKEDFENGASTAGWTNAIVSSDGAFTTFLGRYGVGTQQEFGKTFTGIPTDVDEVTLEYNMYEVSRSYVVP